MNFDLTNERLLVPTALFILLSPGLLLQLPSLKFATMQTDMKSSVIHSLVFVLLYFLLAKTKIVKSSLTPADLAVPALIFLALNVTMNTTSPMQIGVRALIFFIVFALIRQFFPQFY